jgi:carbon-monoxide dehydrogenase small subunit
MHAITLYVNGRAQRAVVDPLATLLQVLRDECSLSGTKEGCGTGYCGACTVLVDGMPVNACLYFAVDADHREVTTVEGAGARRASSSLQQAFVEHGASQCGYCTPGMIMAGTALLESRSDPADADVRDAIAGNLCRCTGYQPIVRAVLAASAHLQEGDGDAPRQTTSPVRTRA